jgi:Zn-dependent protease with chaperone function
MTGVRFARALWPVIFLVPLSWWADRGCSFAGVDPLYHTTLWVHERLGWFLAALIVVSAAVVVSKIVVARMRFGRLAALAEPAPARLQSAVENAARELETDVPRVVYLDVTAPIASAVFGDTILLSRGFIAPLGDAELALAARHEVAHVRRHDATAGVLWHLGFAALLIPGFEPLERRLHARRERAANLEAAKGREQSYLALVARLAQGAAVCADAPLGLEAAARRPGDRWLMWAAPIGVGALAVALPLSHVAFRHDLPYLLSHHC